MRLRVGLKIGLMAELGMEGLGMEMGVGIGTVWGWWGWDSVSGGHGHPTLGQYPEGAPMGL